MKEKIKKIIQNRSFSQFKGLKEDICFEIKNKRPYDFDSASDRYEFAKDVSSFANSQGGYIIFGLTHEPVPEEQTERVKELDLMKESAFPINKSKGLIIEYIYPSIVNIEIKWVESNEKPGFGIGYILIPHQSKNKKYFLIKSVVEDNQPMKEIIFGIAQRIESSNIPFTVKQLYRELQQGKSSTSERLTRIESKIDSLTRFPVPRVSKRKPVEELEKRISKIEIDE